MEQTVRFCTAQDGVRIAYATIGNGPPLVKAANWLNHLEYDWQSPVWRHWLTELARSHTLIRCDERGCGLSDWQVDDFSLEAWVSDLETVVEAFGLEKFPLLGISQGGPGAGARRKSGRPHRPVVAGRGDVRNADRRAAIQRRTRAGGAIQHPESESTTGALAAKRCAAETY